MSDIAPDLVVCPRCQVEQRATVFTSLNADFIAVQVELILDGSFERMACQSCAHRFQPEHRMLYAHYSARSWIVMYPPAARSDFASLEREVEEVMARQFETAPPLVAASVRGVRPRLVFGQHMLREAVRAARDGIDATLLECAKLMAIREHLGVFMPLGPFELCFEGVAENGELGVGVYRLASSERLGRFGLEPDAVARMRAQEPELAERYPDLFNRPYISACRVLYGETI